MKLKRRADFIRNSFLKSGFKRPYATLRKIPHKEREIFHEYRDLITELKGKNARFDSLFEKHDELDHKIADAQAGRVHMSDLEIDAMKKEKLRIKDELGSLLAQYKSEKSGK